jgi:hypothetical protein
MSVVRRQLCPDLVEADDGKVDQKAENAGAEEVPESDGGEIENRPPMRERPGPGLLA